MIDLKVGKYTLSRGIYNEWRKLPWVAESNLSRGIDNESCRVTNKLYDGLKKCLFNALPTIWIQLLFHTKRAVYIEPKLKFQKSVFTEEQKVQDQKGIKVYQSFSK